MTESHRCEGALPSAIHGDAFSVAYEQADGSLWVENGEYASQVNFCPYCGFKAKVQLQPVTEDGGSKWVNPDNFWACTDCGGSGYNGPHGCPGRPGENAF